MRISDWSSDVGSSDLRAVKGGVEAGDLGNGCGSCRESTDACEVVRLVQRGQRHEALERAEPAGVDQHGGGEVGAAVHHAMPGRDHRSEEHTSELQSLMRISYAVFCLKKKTKQYIRNIEQIIIKQCTDKIVRTDYHKT